MMKYSVALPVLAAVTFLLSQCQGAVYPFNNKPNTAAKYLFETQKRNTFSTDDHDGYGEPISLKLRDRRQSGIPQAYSFNLRDNRRYARTLYSGEGSKVLKCSYQYSNDLSIWDGQPAE